MIGNDNIQKDDILKDIIPDDFEENKYDSFIHEDATKAFETGADEMAMIQPDINVNTEDTIDTTIQEQVTES